jgi:hypothetical protein
MSTVDIVFLTHNHFPGRKKQGQFRGILPVNENGQIFKLSPMAIDARNKDAFELDVISEPWVKSDDTGYTVMLKTLQQARLEGIWKPCLEYLYRWGNRLYCTDRGSETDMGIPLDVGVFTISSQTQRSLGRQRYGGTELMLIIDYFPVGKYKIYVRKIAW